MAQGRSYLGADGTTLVNGMSSDITGLQAFGGKDRRRHHRGRRRGGPGTDLTEFRVYLLVLPVVDAVAQTDRIVAVFLPAVQDALSKLEADENSSNQAVLGPIVANIQAQVQLATSATNGLSAQLLAYTPAEWDADHGLLNGRSTNLRIGDRALVTIDNDVREADRYLRYHHVPPTTTSTTAAPTRPPRPQHRQQS